MKLQDKAAVVTGASRGVGKATALALAREGCSVLVNYSRAKSEAEETAAEIRALGVKALAFPADVASDSACRKMMAAAAQEFGRLDILVNNAATTQFISHSDLEALTEAHWDRLFAVNVKGAFFCARAASEFMRAQKSGDIVNVSSIAGIYAKGSSIAYCASKAALINMTMSLARVLGPDIRVNSVAPGFIASQWTKEGLGADYESTKLNKERDSVLGRVSQPEDIAEVILALLTGMKMVTGRTIVCDGGALIA